MIEQDGVMLPKSEEVVESGEPEGFSGITYADWSVIPTLTDDCHPFKFTDLGEGYWKREDGYVFRIVKRKSVEFMENIVDLYRLGLERASRGEKTYGVYNCFMRTVEQYLEESNNG